jgi:hypothetical protein
MLMIKLSMLVREEIANRFPTNVLRREQWQA